jgi:hypothetical protein
MTVPVRRQGLVVRELGDETLVYDRARHQAHCLNRTAGAVFRLCDGTREVSAIASALEGTGPPPAREALVAEALEQLAAGGLLEGPAEGSSPAAAGPVPESGNLGRRELLLRLGPTLLLPAIVSIVAPTPAQAASCYLSGIPVVEAADCVAGSGQRCYCAGYGVNCGDAATAGDCDFSLSGCCNNAPGDGVYCGPGC